MQTDSLQQVAALVRMHLDQPASSWSVGELGALAEFHLDGAARRDGDFTLACAGGALRVLLLPPVRMLACETPSANARLWNHVVLFCLPRDLARMVGRTLVCEVGVDDQAIDPAARADVLFDLGLGLQTADFMVRTGDAALLRVLRRAQGFPWSDAVELQHAVVAASPVRVVASRLARIEVCNAIPTPDGASPQGPHTHLLPALLQQRRVHDANLPVPDGLWPCLCLYPARRAG